MLKFATTLEEDIGRPPMEIMPVSRSGLDKGWLDKRASVLEDDRKIMEPKEGKTPIYMIPISSMSVAGSNRNADYWPGKSGPVKIEKSASGNPSVYHVKYGLEDRYKTFETHAKMYQEHKNSNPALASGEIVKSAYNKPMGRVEVIAYVDNDKWDDSLQKLASMKKTGVSMSARVPYDVCIVCGNKASQRGDYCDHMRSYKNAMLKSGAQVGVINEKPTFFDISDVKLNADRLGFALSTLNTEQEKSGSDNCKSRETAKKLSSMEKEIPVSVVKRKAKEIAPEQRESLPKLKITIIRSYDPGMVGNILKKEKVLLSPDEFVSVAGGKEDEKHVGNMKSMLPGIFEDLLGEGGSISSFLEPMGGSIPLGLKSCINDIVPSHSIGKPEREKRFKIEIKKGDLDLPLISKKKHKSASIDKRASRLAKEYGKYLLTMAEGEDSDTLESIVTATKIDW